jgi:hypothetical protein
LISTLRLPLNSTYISHLKLSNFKPSNPCKFLPHKSIPHLTTKTSRRRFESVPHFSLVSVLFHQPSMKSISLFFIRASCFLKFLIRKTIYFALDQLTRTSKGDDTLFKGNFINRQYLGVRKAKHISMRRTQFFRLFSFSLINSHKFTAKHYR